MKRLIYTRNESIYSSFQTVVAADKFDTVWVARTPPEAKADEGGDHSGLRIKADTDYITGQCHKLDTVATMHVGEMITALQKATLVSGAREVVLYSTIQGSIGALYPFLSKKDYTLLQLLEMHMRNECPPLSGRDHQLFRSFYAPVKNM